MATPTDAADPLANLSTLASFKPQRVLANDREAKTAAVLGDLAGHTTIVRLAREPFDDARLESGEATNVAVTPVVRNDIYLRATGVEGPSTSSHAAPPSLGIEVICPATDKHIAKYSDTRRTTVVETRAAYEAVTLPAVLATPPSRTAWVDNILDGSAEADRVVARFPPLDGGGDGGGGGPPAPPGTTPFVLLPDLKWGGVDPSRLYAVAIFGDPALRSIRDIDSPERVDAVRAVYTACLSALEQQYGARPPALRAFFHYHPSYWRLHIHFAAHGVPASDGVGKAHAVEDVLAEGGGVAHRALTVVLAEGDPLVEGLAVAARTG